MIGIGSVIPRKRLVVTSDSSSRIRISIGGAELDLQGDAAFIDKYDDTIQALLAKLTSLTPSDTQVNTTRQAAMVPPAPLTVGSTAAPALEAGDDFGEVYHRVPRSATNVDKALVAAWFLHRSKEAKVIETRAVSSLLVEQGVRLSNASQAMTNNLNRKFVFKSGGGYRMSREGIEFVERLLNQTN
jgi:hypothetical protein